MTAILQRIQSLTNNIPLPFDKKDRSIGSFRQELAEKDTVFFTPLVRKHLVLTLEYSVLCTRLIHNFSSLKTNSYNTQKDINNIEDQLISALMMAELLEYLYCNYLGVPREVERLRSEINHFKKLLNDFGYRFNNDSLPQKNLVSPSLAIRNNTFQLNWVRLFTLRTRRFLQTILPLVDNFQTLARPAAAIDLLVTPVFNYIAWIFYVPRFSTNLFLLIKHVIPGPWMKNSREAELQWFYRLEARLERRWFELINDSVWLTAGVLTCFVITGGTPIAVFLALSLFLFDAIMAATRALIEIYRTEKLLEDYDVLLKKAAPEEIEDIKAYKEFLSQRIDHERKIVLLSAISTSLLLLASCLSIPALVAASPIIPFIGAALILTTTLATFIAWQMLEKQRPVDNVKKLQSFGFFQSPKEINVANQTVTDITIEEAPESQQTMSPTFTFQSMYNFE